MSRLFDVVSALRLEDGRHWGDVAEPWQRDDVSAFLADDGPRRHYWLRGRGMSKTGDGAAAALALMAVAPARSRSFLYAVDREQAGIALDSIAGYVGRTRGLADRFEVGSSQVTVRPSDATLTVVASDGASAFGTRPWLVIADELASWPNTTNHRRLWAAITSALPKVPGSRLLVCSTAGPPVGLGSKVWGQAEGSRHWRTSLRPGPCPWWSEDDLDAVASDLTPAEYQRLILCEWAEGDDSLAAGEDVLACVRPGDPVLPPKRGVRYVCALDVGVRRDLTALAVAHSESWPTGRVVVVDRVVHWRPRRGIAGRVDLDEVETTVRRVAREYRAGVVFDRHQAEQLSTNLARSGVRVSEFVFSQAGATRLARTLLVALRDHAMQIPDDPELIAELQSVRLIETGPGTLKLSNPAGTHDDVAVAVGMAAATLLDQPVGGSRTASPVGRRIDSRPPPRPEDQSIDAQVRRAARGASRRSRSGRTVTPRWAPRGSDGRRLPKVAGRLKGRELEERRRKPANEGMNDDGER